jgi:hypothetical protein
MRCTLSLQRAIVCLLIPICIAGCTKKNENNGITFEGITARDQIGIPMANEDPDDWRFDDTVWPGGVAQHFKGHSTGCTAPDSFLISAYPNPTTSNAVNIYLNKDPATVVWITVYDRYLHPLVSTPGITGDHVGLKLSPADKGIYRAYYELLTTDSCVFRGHGDIEVK